MALTAELRALLAALAAVASGIAGAADAIITGPPVPGGPPAGPWEAIPVDGPAPAKRIEAPATAAGLDPAQTLPDLRDPAWSVLGIRREWSPPAAGAGALPVPQPPASWSGRAGPTRPLPVDGTLRGPILIAGDAGFLLPESGVVRGAGSRDDPYVISGWRIPAQDGRGPAIALRDTSAHVVVEGNVVEDALPREARATVASATNLTWDGPYLFQDEGGHKPQAFSIWIENASNVTLRSNVAKAVHLSCRGCVVEENRVRHVRADALVGSRFEANDLLTLFVESGSGNQVIANRVSAWERWAFPFRFREGSVAEVTGNSVRGAWQNGIVADCAGGAIVLRGNEIRLENAFGRDDAVRVTGCASATVEGNEFHGGTLRFPGVTEVRVSQNRLFGASIVLRDVERGDVSSNRIVEGTITISGGGVSRVAGNGFANAGAQTFNVEDLAAVTLEANDFRSVSLTTRNVSMVVERNTFTGGRVLLREADGVVLRDNAIAGGRGVEVRSAPGARVEGNRVEEAEIGIHVEDSPGARVTRNVARGVVLGLEISGSPRSVLSHNRVEGADAGLVILRSAEGDWSDNALVDVERPGLVWGSERGDFLGDLRGTHADGRPFLALLGCSGEQAALAAGLAAYLVLVSCSPVAFGAEAPVGGVAAHGTTLRAEGATFQRAITALAVADSPAAEAAGIRVEGGIALLAGGVGRVLLEGSTLHGAAVSIEGSDEVVLSGNDVTAATLVVGSSARLVAEGNRLVGGFPALATRDVPAPVVRENRFERCGFAVALVGTATALVEGNEVDACGYGIGVRGAVAARHNALHAAANTAGYGIGVFLAGAASEIRGNVAVGFGEGLRVENDYLSRVKATIAENVFADGRFGSFVTGGSDLTFEGNVFLANERGHVGVCEPEGAELCTDRFLGNRFERNERTGLYLEVAFADAIEGNDFEGNGIGLEWLLLPTVLAPPPACAGALNWWGAATGPRDPFNPAAGTGDEARCWIELFLVQVKRSFAYAAWLPAAAGRATSGAFALTLAVSDPQPAVDERVRFDAAAAGPGAEHLFVAGDGAYRVFAPDAAFEHAYDAPGERAAWALARHGAGGELAFARAVVRVG